MFSKTSQYFCFYFFAFTDFLQIYEGHVCRFCCQFCLNTFVMMAIVLSLSCIENRLKMIVVVFFFNF